MEQHRGVTQTPIKVIKVILDTSVLLKWVFTEEENADKAIALKDRHLRGELLIIIPELATYEFANVIQHPRRGLSPQQVQDFVDLLYETGLLVISSDRRIQKMATAMASFIGVSVRARMRQVVAHLAFFEVARGTTSAGSAPPTATGLPPISGTTATGFGVLRIFCNPFVFYPFTLLPFCILKGKNKGLVV